MFNTHFLKNPSYQNLFQDTYVMPPLRDWDIAALEKACGGIAFPSGMYHCFVSSIFPLSISFLSTHFHNSSHSRPIEIVCIIYFLRATTKIRSSRFVRNESLERCYS